MPAATPLHELMYVSTLSPGATLSVIPDIARQARAANKLLGITGLLVFDGERFCQQLEGGLKAVRQLFEQISADVRHVNVQLVHQGPLAGRRFQKFSMGYAPVEDIDVLGELELLDGDAAVDVFVRMVATVDMDP